MSIRTKNIIDLEICFILEEGTQTKWNKTRVSIIYFIKQWIPNNILHIVLNDYILKFIIYLFCLGQIDDHRIL